MVFKDINWIEKLTPKERLKYIGDKVNRRPKRENIVQI